jgi:PAS domain S-box-containing protein
LVCVRVPARQFRPRRLYSPPKLRWTRAAIWPSSGCDAANRSESDELQERRLPVAQGNVMANAMRVDAQPGFEPFELLPDAIIMVDRQGIIRYANGQAGRLFGQERATLVSTPVEVLLPKHLRKSHVGHRAKYSSEPQLRPMGTGLEPYGRRADGATFFRLSIFSAETFERNQLSGVSAEAS